MSDALRREHGGEDLTEFWAGRSNRLHDRLVLVRVDDGALDDASALRLERRQP